MSTYTQIIYHIVFSTKNREPVLCGTKRPDLFRYVCGILKSKKCHVFRINGVSDHLHILCSLHPTVCLANLIKDIKLGVSQWNKDTQAFPNFTYWQNGYGAFTLSIAEKDAAIEYIKAQEEHHSQKPFLDELRDMLRQAGIEFEGKYLD